MQLFTQKYITSRQRGVLNPPQYVVSLLFSFVLQEIKAGREGGGEAGVSSNISVWVLPNSLCNTFDAKWHLSFQEIREVERLSDTDFLRECWVIYSNFSTLVLCINIMMMSLLHHQTSCDNERDIIMQIACIHIHSTNWTMYDYWLFCSLHVPWGHTMPGEVP